MHRMLNRLAMIGLLATLAACNSTDALTPQVDVGGVIPSSAVTQNDIDTMSSDPQPVATSQQTAMVAQTPSEGEIATNSALNGTGMDTAGTLEGQAAALGTGTTSTADTRIADTTRADTATPVAQATAGETATLTPATASSESIRFLPIIGAPVTAVTPLSKRLGTDARANGLVIRSSSDTTSRHVLKGYLSAVADGSGTTVIYVWDVLDNSGARLHRIQGQETVSSKAADPWAAVPARAMETIADKTIDGYLAWRRQTQG